MAERVVVTGMGVVTPIGIGVEKFWNAILNCTNGVRKIVSFNTEHYRTNRGAEVLDFDESQDLGKNYLSMARASKFAVQSGKEAFSQAGLTPEDLKNIRASVTLGTTMGEMQVIEQSVRQYLEKGMEGVESALPGKYPCHIINSNLSGFFNIRGQNIVIPSACAAGNFAIGYGFDHIRMGRSDVVLTGGVDPMSEIAFAGFNKLMACSPDVCSPFDAHRKGMIVGEGAGFLVLESLSHAKKRNATIYAEIKGYGVSNDAFKSTIPHPEGKGGILAMERAMKHAAIKKDEIDYICAHGTGTVENDKVETLISKEVFGKRAYEIPISSLKSMIGHTMGACSAIESIACIKMINEGVLAPTINYQGKDPLCDLDYVPNQPRKAKIKTIISNSYAFGGNNSALIIQEYRE